MTLTAATAAPEQDALLYDVPEACRVIRQSRATLYELNKQGRIRFVKIGRRTLVRHSDLMEFVESL